jgi:hypothetical protein
MDVAIFWDTGSRSPYMNLPSGGAYRLRLGRKSTQQEKNSKQVAIA